MLKTKPSDLHLYKWGGIACFSFGCIFCFPILYLPGGKSTECIGSFVLFDCRPFLRSRLGCQLSDHSTCTSGAHWQVRSAPHGSGAARILCRGMRLCGCRLHSRCQSPLSSDPSRTSSGIVFDSPHGLGDTGCGCDRGGMAFSGLGVDADRIGKLDYRTLSTRAERALYVGWGDIADRFYPAGY